MYGWIDDRNFSGSKNFQALSLISKTFSPLIKNKFELSNFNRLPVIKEEEGNPNEVEHELQQNPSQKELQKNYQSRKGTYMKESDNEIKNYKRIMEAKSVTRLPPLASMNCSLDINTRHAQDIWETKCGKYLMTGKNSEEDMNLSEIKVSSNSAKKCNEKFGDCLPSKFLPRRKSIQEQNVRNDVGHIGEVKHTKSNRKKLKKLSIKDPNLKNIYNQEKVQSKKTFDGNLSFSSFNKNHQFFTEGIHSFIRHHAKEINCKNATDTFLNVESLCKQRKQHEAEREACFLCEKMFYNSQKFVHHLLTHETLDKVNCKKCKTHFINSKNYKEHCKDFHLTPSDNIKSQSLESAKKWLPKFECKRCRIVFDSEQNYEAHRRMHIKKDLAEEYFKSSDN